MTCEGKELHTLTEKELWEAKTCHETRVLVQAGKSDFEEMHKEEMLALSVQFEMFRRIEASPSMVAIRKRLSEEQAESPEIFDF